MLFDSRIRDKLKAKRDIHEGHLHRSRNRDFDLRFEYMRCLAKDWYILNYNSRTIIVYTYNNICKIAQISILFLLSFFCYSLCIREKKEFFSYLKNFTVRSFPFEITS